MSTPRPIRPYGDKKNDGAVQVSFTLPLARSAVATEAAKRYAAKMGLREPYVTLAEAIAPEFTFFVVYGRATHDIDVAAITAEEAPEGTLSREQIDEEIARRFGRRLVVLGCALESDAHTVGLDAIFNMKGFAGDYGLERYHGFDARNLCAQVPVAELARLVRETRADAVLVSCGGLMTLGCAVPLEQRHGIPVVTSTQSAFWKALRLAGDSGHLPDRGQMLAQSEPAHA